MAYTSASTATKRRIFVKPLDRGTEPKLVRTHPGHVHVTSWSPDGRWLAAVELAWTTAANVWAIPLDGGEAVSVAHAAMDPQFSPDGKWIAYASRESGRAEVYAVAFPELTSRRQVSADGGRAPAWDRQGRFVYYLQQGYLVAHEVRLGTGLTVGRATRLFATPASGFEVAPGNRFVLTEPNPQSADEPLHLIVNWFTELRTKVPAR